MPQVLTEKGGWASKESVKRYKDYTDVIFDEFGSEVPYFSTFNETTMEFFVADYNINPNRSKETPNVRYATEMDRVYNQLIASDVTIWSYHAKHMKGAIGITFNLAPCLPLDPGNPNDVAAAPIEDALLNRIVLDPTFKGRYPKKHCRLVNSTIRNLSPRTCICRL